jgi:hypothetical protein
MKKPSSKFFGASIAEIGVRGGNALIAEKVSQAIAKMQAVDVSDEFRAMGAYMLVADQLEQLEKAGTFLGIYDSEVCEAVWSRCGYAFGRPGNGFEWGQTVEYAEVAKALAEHGITVDRR